MLHHQQYMKIMRDSPPGSKVCRFLVAIPSSLSEVYYKGANCDVLTINDWESHVDYQRNRWWNVAVDFYTSGSETSSHKLRTTRGGLTRANFFWRIAFPAGTQQLGWDLYSCLSSRHYEDLRRMSWSSQNISRTTTSNQQLKYYIPGRLVDLTISLIMREHDIEKYTPEKLSGFYIKSPLSTKES